MSIPEGWSVAQRNSIFTSSSRLGPRCGLVFYAQFCQQPNCSTLQRFEQFLLGVKFMFIFANVPRKGIGGKKGAPGVARRHLLPSVGGYFTLRLQLCNEIIKFQPISSTMSIEISDT